ncbi:MAG: sigma-70 family RNA polymerase sigma factor [FCB group bacterium]|jgi:RNA polymerase sigma factor (sigma-70 family)|nr:sigma-70 family RNA polymerase sigma factor [FCB group bacterium]
MDLTVDVCPGGGDVLVKGAQAVDHLPDNVLFDRWNASRDAEAFSEIATRYAGLVYATCRRILNDPSEAEDVAQECFVYLLERRDGSPLGPWLHRLATHRALDRLRGNARRARRDDLFANQLQKTVEPHWSGIEAHLDEAISALPEELRVPLVRHFLEGHSYATLARLLGVPKSTLAKRVQQGLEEVRAALRRKGIDAAPGLAPLLARHGIEMPPPTLRASLGKLALAGMKSSIVSPLIAGGGAVVIKKVLAGIAALVALAVFTAGGVTAYRALTATRHDAAGTSSAKPPTASPLLQATTQNTSRQDARVPKDKKDSPALTTPEGKVPFATLLQRLAAAPKSRVTSPASITSNDIPADNGAHFFLLASELTPDLDQSWLEDCLDEIQRNGWTNDPKLMAYIAASQDAFAAIREGIKRGNAELPLASGPLELLDYASKYRTLARLMAAEGQMYASQGNVAAAFEDFATIAEFANESSRGGCVVNELVGYALLDQATDAAGNALVNSNVTAAECRAYIARIQAIEAREVPMSQAVQNEAESFGAWFAAEFKTGEDVRAFFLAPDITYGDDVRQWVLESSDEELLAAAHEYLAAYEGMAESLELPYWETQSAGSPQSPTSTVAALGFGAIQNLPSRAAYSAALRDGTVIQAALEAFRIEQGAYPGSLDQLAPAYLSNVPADSFTGQGFCYSADNNGYSLYSAGADMQNDGGTLDDYKAPGGDLIFRAP